ncbi:DUF3219 family protein [Niallia sp. 01092]|uniref:DUF3219 family protein n=1 Tax=unclassified Niallia TaxID=2837522 RepID=UPI003FD371A9
MVKAIVLDHTSIDVNSYQEEKINGLHQISVVFSVTSEDYHDITTLLYKGMFHVSVPEKDLVFRGAIHQYSTSITNLYKKGKVGEFSLSIREMKHEEGRQS